MAYIPINVIISTVTRHKTNSQGIILNNENITCRGGSYMKNEKPHKPEVQCKSLYKDKNNIKNSLSIIWTDIINHLENDRKIMYNGNRRATLTHQTRKDEVSKK